MLLFFTPELACCAHAHPPPRPSAQHHPNLSRVACGHCDEGRQLTARRYCCCRRSCNQHAGTGAPATSMLVRTCHITQAVVWVRMLGTRSLGRHDTSLHTLEAAAELNEVLLLSCQAPGFLALSDFYVLELAPYIEHRTQNHHVSLRAARAFDVAVSATTECESGLKLYKVLSPATCQQQQNMRIDLELAHLMS